MDKPFSITYEEFKQNLSNLINSSGLPPIIVESVLQNYLNEISIVVRNQYLLDKERYEKESNVKNDC